MTNKKTILSTIMMVIASTMIFAGPATATTCTEAGDFSGICNTFVGIANATLAIIGIVFTGSNASTVIQAILVIAIVMVLWDLARGESSYLRRRFR